MGEQPNVLLVAHVREIGEIEEGGDLNDERSVEENKHDQAKTSTTEPVMFAEGLRPLSQKLVQKIQNWEFSDLEELLPNPHSHMDTAMARWSPDNSVH